MYNAIFVAVTLYQFYELLAAKPSPFIFLGGVRGSSLLFLLLSRKHPSGLSVHFLFDLCCRCLLSSMVLRILSGGRLVGGGEDCHRTAHVG